jgi:hypothetical protein
MLPLDGCRLIYWLAVYLVVQDRVGTVRFCLGDMNECIRNAKLCAMAQRLTVARAAAAATSLYADQAARLARPLEV